MPCQSGIVYRVQPGETLAGIASRELGDSSRWLEIKKPDGTFFTEQEAAQLQPGQEICVPTQLPPENSLKPSFVEIVSREIYENIFPDRASLYGYDKLVTAIEKYPHFCTEGTEPQRKREAAAFLAHIAHETEGLRHVEEADQGNWSDYCDADNATYPCKPGLTYHGRGPIQLSWNYNYGAAGQALAVDLLSNPDLVKTDGVIAFQTALWFWMTPQPPKPSIHEAITELWNPSDEDIRLDRKPGFGMTINIINGGKECGKGGNDKADNRINLYKRFSQLLGVDEGENVSCASMQPYDPI